MDHDMITQLNFFSSQLILGRISILTTLLDSLMEHDWLSVSILLPQTKAWV